MAYLLYTSTMQIEPQPQLETLWFGAGLLHTGKGGQDLRAGGRRVHVIAAITYGKGVFPYEKN